MPRAGEGEEKLSKEEIKALNEIMRFGTIVENKLIKRSSGGIDKLQNQC